MSRTLKCFMILTWIFGSFWPSCALATNRIMGIRHWVAPDHTRVVIDTVDEAIFSVEKGERKLIIDLEDTSFPNHISQPILINKPGLEGVAIATRAPSGVRVELALPAQVQTTVFKLKPLQDKPYRIVIDIVLPEVAKQESEARERVKITRKDRIVVIDPGHGGEAVGAVGKKGTFEKDVVLSISRKLQRALNKRPGYRAFLTRDDDYYVSFRKRMMIAKEYGADLFVSIHADAARNRTAGGTSVYCLSTGGASSEAAKILARYENLADSVGGVPNGEGGEDSDPIILDMFQTNTINRSKSFGASLLQHLQKENHLKFQTVQEAPFLVLKLPDVPSVLLETAYISNAKEEKLLKSPRFQTKIAEAVADSIAEFLPPLPPVAVLVTGGKAEKQKDQDKTTRVEALGEVSTAKKEGASRTVDAKPAAKNGPSAPGKAGESPSLREKATFYRVQKGDTLEKIARKHSTSLGILLKLNRIKPRDPLYVNRLLKISEASAEKKGEQGVKAPVSEGKSLPAEKAKKVIYRVKKGDTLATIAKKHGTTVSVLVKLNRLKPTEPIYVDRKLVVSGNPAL
ncbi:MAG: hypothetical protein C0390_02995 [Syntrophus sp. (in: bacteria)]|nr:hypothetical protein [Syntrophus sp. (in: bacteria)]